MNALKHKYLRSVKVFTLLVAGFSLLALLAAPGHSYAVPCPPGETAVDGNTCVPGANGSQSGNSGGGETAPQGTDGCTPYDQSKCTKDTCSALTGGNQTAKWDDDTKTCSVGSGDPAATGGNCASLDNCDLMKKYINPFINLLAVLVGVAVTISIIIGGIQYGSSAGDPQKASAAKARIRNAIIALLTFLFLYALINFLVPGGLFNK